MPATADDRDLLGLDTATRFELAASGRILRENAPDRGAAPRLYLAGCRSGNEVRLRHDVGETTARAIEGLAESEPALCEVGSTPVHFDEYLRLLGAEAPVEDGHAGLNWAFPARIDYRHPAALITSDTPEGDRLLALLVERGMPEALVALGFVDTGEFWAPWCVALDGDAIASIAFAARLTPGGAAIGVTTVPAYRGRGFAAAATAGWASLPALAGRTLFYSHDRTNISSRRVVDRLGLRFLGASFSVT